MTVENILRKIMDFALKFGGIVLQKIKVLALKIGDTVLRKIKILALKIWDIALREIKVLSPKIKLFALKIKNPALFAGWTLGLVLIGVLIWTLLRPMLYFDFMRAVNRSFTASGESRRLVAPLAHPPAKPAPLGIWYTLYGSGDLFFVFTIMQDGVMIPCGAHITPDGKVVEVIPVSAHARKVFDRVPGGIIQIYTRRIETVAAQWSKK